MGKGDDIVERELHPLKLDGPGVYPYQIVVIERLVKGDAEIDDRVDVPAFLDLPVGIGGIPHERGPAEFKISEIIGMIHDLGPVCVRVQSPVLAPVPNLAACGIADVSSVVAVRLRPEGLRLHHTPLNTAQQFVPPKPNALERTISWLWLRALSGTTSTPASSGSGM